MDLVLSKINSASVLLEKATTLQDAKSVIALADAARVYAKRIGASNEAINHAAAFKLRAERKLGEMLKVSPKNKGGNPKLPTGAKKEPVETLADLGISKKTSSRAQALADTPDEEFEAALTVTANTEINPNQVAKKLVKQKQKKAKREKKAAVPQNLPPLPDRCQLIHADLATVNGQVPTGSVDWIITDPPYPKEYLGVYDALSKFADRVLKPGGSLLAMVGQSYLPDIMARLSTSLNYHWTLAYLTPGGQAVQLWDRISSAYQKCFESHLGEQSDTMPVVADEMKSAIDKWVEMWHSESSVAAS